MMMNRKNPQFILLALIAILMMIVPSRVSGQTGVVGVRIPSGEMDHHIRASVPGDIVIDYGTFLWSVMTPQDLVELDRGGIAYQTIENPYTLTLGGQSFDPLVSMPTFDVAWETPSQDAEPRLNLVQFHGPTKAEWLEALEDDGLAVLQYIHPFTYVVWGETSAIEQSKRRGFVRWAGDYLPAFAVQPQNRVLSSDTILVRAMIYPGAGLPETLLTLENLGGTVLSTATESDPVFDLVTLMLPGNLIRTAASLPGVYTLQPVPTDGGDRGEMSNQINVGNTNSSNLAYPGYLDWLSQLDLSGEGVIIANVDSGIDQDHPDLLNRILPCTGSTCGYEVESNHGTHTAGIMAGDGSSGVMDAYEFLRGLGMAPAANLVEQVYSPTYTLPGGVLTLMTQSYQNGAVISGNSWGPSGTPQGYDADTRLVDIGVRDADPGLAGNQPLTYILSIMNGYGGISSQGTPDEAKNIFTIGSTVMQTAGGAQNTYINDLSANSAHGPALDGRSIPHLVAPGSYVDSTILSDSHGLMSGTSMASPHVTGAVALFFEQYREQYGMDPSPAVVKAAFLPVAHDLAGNHDADGGVLGHPFDSKQGWGRLDAAAVLDPEMTVLYFDQPASLDETGETWTYEFSTSDPLLELRAMLVWSDAPGHGLGGTTPAWVNDLDLSLSIDGQTYYGNHFGSDGYSITGGVPDGMNNTEGIFLSTSPSGTYTLIVTAANISGDGIPNQGDGTDQDFALVIYLIDESVNNAPMIIEDDPQYVTMSEDSTPTPFNLTLHATDTDGDTLSWSILSPASFGTATASGTGTSTVIGYTPNNDYFGPDSFVVLVEDGNGGKDMITINVTIEPINDAPVITGQTTSLITPEDTALLIELTDLIVTDVDNTFPDEFTLTVMTGTNYTILGNSITPLEDFIGTLTVPVKVNDGANDSNLFDLSITVTEKIYEYVFPIIFGDD